MQLEISDDQRSIQNSTDLAVGVDMRSEVEYVILLAFVIEYCIGSMYVAFSQYIFKSEVE